MFGAFCYGQNYFAQAYQPDIPFTTNNKPGNYGRYIEVGGGMSRNERAS